jgi:hypothetical protein
VTIHAGLLGLSWEVWGVVCLAVAIIYSVIRPRSGRAGSRWRHLVLRGCHALVWVLLALSCFLRASTLPQVGSVAAGVALVGYVVFIATLVSVRRTS